MRKRLLFISLVLALVLTTLVPAAALAAKPVPFSATGEITYISPGTVLPAGESGRWRVIERELGGFLTGDINDSFTMTYKANVELATQAGNLHGTLEAGSYVAKVNGKIEGITETGEYVWWEVLPGYWTWMPKLMLTISGHWTFIQGAHGNGDFDADVVFVPTLDGHVDTVFPDESPFTMTGQWQP